MKEHLKPHPDLSPLSLVCCGASRIALEPAHL